MHPFTCFTFSQIEQKECPLFVTLSFIDHFISLTIGKVVSVFVMATCSETVQGVGSRLPSSTLGELLETLGLSSLTLGGSCLAGRLCLLLSGWAFSMQVGVEGTATLAPPTAP